MLMEMWNYLRMKLKQEKGEVSVEWALVAVMMALIIALVFMPGVRGGLQTALSNITAKLGTTTAP